MNPNRNKKKRKNNKETKSDYIVSADAVSFGIVCQRTINQRKISKTNFGYPRNVIIGFGGKSNNVLFEYVSSKENGLMVFQRKETIFQVHIGIFLIRTIT